MFDVSMLENDSLMVGRPKGILDAALAKATVEFIEVKEAQSETGFNRFCDLSSIERIHLGIDDVAALAARRRAYNPNKIRVKSAFLATSPLTIAIVHLYKAWLRSPRIEVRGFRSLEEAATWLGVEPRKLAP